MKIVTIGVYGFDKEQFFHALINANVDTFCDTRRRRGMRGSEYAFVNSIALQQKLGELGIRYIYAKDLAPSQEVRDKQKQEDEKLGVAKRSRKGLGKAFIQGYEQQCLSSFNTQEFVEKLGSGTKVLGLFCVEREPEACHRSLVANKLVEDLKLQIYDVVP